MIAWLFNKPHVLWQKPDEDGGVANDALAVSVDNDGTICIRQGESEIVVGVQSVPELCRLLTKLAKEEI